MSGSTKAGISPPLVREHSFTMRLLLGKRAPTLIGQLLTLSFLTKVSLCAVDLTAANRRPPITGLPDWSKAGYMQGTRDLPTTADCQYTYTPQFLRDTYGLIPDDGVDDTHALEQAIYWARRRLETASIPEEGFVCIQLPAGMTRTPLHTTRTNG